MLRGKDPNVSVVGQGAWRTVPALTQAGSFCQRAEQLKKQALESDCLVLNPCLVRYYLYNLDNINSFVLRFAL